MQQENTPGPADNLQGGYKFFDIFTVRNITCISFTALPMPSEVIDRVDQIRISEVQTSLLISYYSKFNPIGYYDTKSLGVDEVP